MGRKRVFESFVPSDSEDSDDGDLKEHKHHDATWGNEELTVTDSSEGVQSDDQNSSDSDGINKQCTHCMFVSAPISRS